MNNKLVSIVFFFFVFNSCKTDKSITVDRKEYKDRL